jgi:hypothetical protein
VKLAAATSKPKYTTRSCSLRSRKVAGNENTRAQLSSKTTAESNKDVGSTERNHHLVTATPRHAFLLSQPPNAQPTLQGPNNNRGGMPQNFVVPHPITITFADSSQIMSQLTQDSSMVQPYIAAAAAPAPRDSSSTARTSFSSAAAAPAPPLAQQSLSIGSQGSNDTLTCCKHLFRTLNLTFHLLSPLEQITKQAHPHSLPLHPRRVLPLHQRLEVVRLCRSLEWLHQ